ncbi:prepilin peptidase [Mesorhizobium sp. M7A.F.Ca.MR.245.00.0.0]|uniref:prepilin peptidase n=1 Tax=Mesorhizobium sp. M7A.F.Ca.MR.245.00.0.0 TaxID=2496778 RepID=UPI000FCA8463|nr:prepilin peptidase [Mesorhizobium sp. M7A.F.Ca.MR.245.00.0.0]RUV19302.1 prepilin peptidase [Mesorhizobium sp. M7A.F.Ca.MR.245.00.0.0]RUV50881.1 prepilin peptidase [Mesorhizobium sp. M7A.F.Ca.MR.228.00.0.0]
MLLVEALLLKALAIPLLARIAWIDFTTQKIANRDVLLLLCLGAGSLILLSIQSGSWLDMGLSAGAGLLLFVALLPFWALRKIGAGDVKLLAVVPFLIGGRDFAMFSVLLLVLALATAAIVKKPFLLPAGAFRLIVQHLDRKGVVPFGVPISLAAICTMAVLIYQNLMLASGSGILNQLN